MRLATIRIFRGSMRLKSLPQRYFLQPKKGTLKVEAELSREIAISY